VFSITLTGNVTSSTFTNLVPGQQITMHILQDGSGGHTFAWPSGTVGSGVVDTTPNQINAQVFSVSLASTVIAVSPLTLQL
jgi:hypothetical protein